MADDTENMTRRGGERSGESKNLGFVGKGSEGKMKTKYGEFLINNSMPEDDEVDAPAVLCWTS